MSPEDIGEVQPIGGSHGSLPLCLHCNRQPKRIVRMYGSQLVWLCEIHFKEYRGVSLAADGGGR